MFVAEHEVEIRYAETDQMGVVYHSNYLVWLELGRTKLTQDLLFITKPTVTTKEAANLLGVTIQTILKKEKDGLIECVYKDNWKQFGSFPDLIYVKTVDGATLRISAASFVL